jgi:sensor histidine kinase YesM
MLIQPHLENAIWHGLRYKESKGQLKLEFSEQEKQIIVSVTDNGIGITKSKSLKTEHQKIHESRGVSNTMERIKLLNEIYKTKIAITIKEINDNGNTGTSVIISLPLMMKK